jgi:putative endonuclease
MSEERRYFVYIIANASKRLYTGMTNSLRRRVREHKLKLTPGLAAKYNMTRLVYFESFEDVRNAIEREKQVKARTRAKRLALVESTNPKWDDLSGEWDKPQDVSVYAEDRVGRAARSLGYAARKNQDPSLRSG